jgi:hypothetical protein
MFVAVPEQAADLVERVVLVAPVAEGVLLHPAAYFIDELGAQAHDMVRVEDGHCVRELVADGVRVAAERVERGMLDTGEELLRLLFEPARVRGA